MRGLSAIFVALLIMVPGLAMAQTAISGSGSSSTANSTSKSNSNADALSNIDFAATIAVTQGGTTLNGSDVPSIAFGSVALSGLANGEGCVLSQTESFNASIAVAGFGGGAGYGNGKTVPYDICNDFKSLVVLQALNPDSIVCETVNPNQNCHSVGQVAGRIVAHLPGVPDALEELSGGKPTGTNTSSLPPPPSDQDAKAKDAPQCLDSLPTAQKMAKGCIAG